MQAEKRHCHDIKQRPRLAAGKADDSSFGKIVPAFRVVKPSKVLSAEIHAGHLHSVVEQGDNDERCYD